MAKNETAVAWYHRLDPDEKRTLWACFGGWALNSLDFFIFAFALPAIIAALGMTQHEALRVASWTLVASAIGGWVAGALADRYGRVHVLQITILWFAFFGLLCAFVQDYWQLLACRMLMGLGLGGEWAVGAVLLAEVIRPKDRGKAVGTMQSGWAIGWGIAALISVAILLHLKQDIAWRALLCVGLLPALLIFYIRRHIREAEVFTETRKNLRAKGKIEDYRHIFSPALIKKTLLLTFLAAGVQGGYLASAWFLEALRNARKIASMGTGRYLVAVIVGSIIGYLISAYLNDRIGRRPTFIIFAICSAATIFALTLLAANDMSVLVLGFFLGLFASGTFSGLGPVMTENFPTAIRGSGQSFCYNAARLLAAGVPGLISWLSERPSFNRWIDVIAIVAYGLVIVMAYLLPETRGKSLSSRV
ncbi:MAG TPA: MFS transporter [Xanthobacteraceae bacterium]|nr:MFS transporter [Xanthobacteraceae bacterium]